MDLSEKSNRRYNEFLLPKKNPYSLHNKLIVNVKLSKSYRLPSLKKMAPIYDHKCLQQ